MEETWKDPGTIRPPENGPEPAPARCPECGETVGHPPFCKELLTLRTEVEQLRREREDQWIGRKEAEDLASKLSRETIEAAAMARLLRARVAELEAQHDQAGDAFASGRRYERAWAGLSGGHFWPQAITEHGRMIDRLGNVLAGQLGPSFAAVVAHVAELEAECQRRFVQTSNDGERIAKLAAMVERVRVLAAHFAKHASILRSCSYNDYDRGRAIAVEDAHKDLQAALLPKEAP